MSTSPSHLEAHAGFFRLSMNGKFDGFFTVTFWEKVDFQIIWFLFQFELKLRTKRFRNIAGRRVMLKFWRLGGLTWRVDLEVWLGGLTWRVDLVGWLTWRFDWLEGLTCRLDLEVWLGGLAWRFDLEVWLGGFYTYIIIGKLHFLIML